MVQRLLNSSEQAKLGWTIAYRLLLGICGVSCTIGIAAFWLVSDRHNDSRYVQSIEYAADKARSRELRDLEKLNDKEMREQIRVAQDKQFEDIKLTLREIAADVKQSRKP